MNCYEAEILRSPLPQVKNCYSIDRKRHTVAKHRFACNAALIPIQRIKKKITDLPVLSLLLPIRGLPPQPNFFFACGTLDFLKVMFLILYLSEKPGP